MKLIKLCGRILNDILKTKITFVKNVDVEVDLKTRINITFKRMAKNIYYDIKMTNASNRFTNFSTKFEPRLHLRSDNGVARESN